MSGELKPKVQIKVGDVLSARWRGGGRDSADRRKAVVVRALRVWGEAEVENWPRPVRFRIENGLGDDAAQFHLDVPEVLAYEQRIRDAWATLEEHGLTSDTWGRKIHDAELFAVAQLLDQMDTKEDGS